MSRLKSASQTSEFWMSLVGAAGLVCSGLGLPHAAEAIGKYGPMLAGLVLQRVLSKAVKPGQVPFQNAADPPAVASPQGA